jgi:uncharacterized protein YcbK (DUF882 family)
MTIDLRYFDPSEFDDPETGENEMKGAFLVRLDELRHRCGFAFVITSGYRSGDDKEHGRGHAADIAIAGGAQRRRIVAEALKMKFNGIGVYDRHVHIDDRPGPEVLWPGVSR